MIIHLDMDAFYASVEQRDNPALAGKPVIVGGHPNRGVVLAASYEVRPFGVRSAIPMHQALRLAPHAIVVAPRFHAYVEASEQVFRIFEHYTPLIEPLSLDEAFLDVTASHALFGTAMNIATELRRRIRTETGLPCSAGIAETKFVAKIASDFGKPNGQHEVPPGTARAFLAPLPVSRLWGVGPKTDELLKGAGLRTVGEVASHDVTWLTARLGALGQHLWELSQGIDTRVVVPDREAKSIGAQDTFDEDLLGAEALMTHVHSQALRVGRRLRRAGVKTRTVQLTVKYADFTQVTRRHTLDERTDDGQRLYREAMKLLEQKVELGRKVRLTGVSANDLSSGDTQLGLFAEAGPQKNDKLNAALDKIASKYGVKAVVTADLATEDTEDEAPRDGWYREDKPLAAQPKGLVVEADPDE
jgi:DNA polymerase-4